VLYTDGASWGNPGESAAGMVILDADENEVYRGSTYIGQATNNIAEYTAVLEGVRIACNLGIKKLKIVSDSQLIVNQLTGRYKINSSELRAINEKILKIAEKFDQVEFVYSSRENNEAAHNEAENMLKSKQRR